MRPLVPLTAVAALGAGLLIAPGLGDPATAATVVTPKPTTSAAARCKAPRALVNRTPNLARTLPGGAKLRVWDTFGKKRVRITAVRIPAGALHARVIRAGSLSKVATPATQVAKQKSVIVAVNGSVFDPKRGTPVRSVAIDGKPLKAAGKDSSSLAVTKDGQLGLATNRVTGSALLGSVRFTVNGLNEQALRSGGVTVYTSAWGKAKRPAGHAGILVRKGTVVARWSAKSRTKAVPSGYQLLVGSGSVGKQLAAVKVGRSAVVSYRVSLRYFKDARPVAGSGDWRHLLATGSRLVRGGELGKSGTGFCSARNELLRPRTAVGLMPNGDTLVVTFAGNKDGSGGVSVHQEARYLQQLGVVDAVNLDGGGSTTMVVRNAVGAKVTRVDRPGAKQRKVPTVLAFDVARR